MSVTLRKRKNQDGSTTLLLDIYHGGKRNYEFLKDLKLSAGGSPQDRQKNKENMELAKRIVTRRAQELSASDYDMSSEHARRVSLLAWMKAYVDNYNKKDLRNMNGVLGRFEQFLKDRKELGLLIKDLDENRVLQFRDQLSRTCQGEGAKSYYARFKKMIRQAVREKLLLVNPCVDVKAPKGEAGIKDTLTFDELQSLANTSTRAEEVKRAFLFSCLTGLRFIDANSITWANVDLKNNTLKLVQSKTGKTVSINLNPNAVELVGQKGKLAGKVFDLPTANGANKALRLWAERAKIDKKITWHCARHSFGTNLIYHGVDLFVTSRLLGHTNVKQTQRYVRAAEDMKEKAVNKLPAIDFNKKQ